MGSETTRPVCDTRLSTRAAFLLYLLLALFVMAPMLSSHMVDCAAADYWAHVGAMHEARKAVQEKQFPLRVTPWQHGKGRYPFFQYYGNFPYTLAGVLSIIPIISPYAAGKLVLVLGLAVGGWYAFRTARVLTRHDGASLIAGAAFLLAPYQWTDIHSRFAYTESVAFNLLPAVLYYSLRSFNGPRRRHILLTGVFWSFTALSHNVVYVYAAAFLGLFFLLRLRPSRKGVVRLARVGAGFALGVVLTLWFIMPQLYTLKDLWVGSQQSQPYGSRMYCTIDVLLSPWMAVSEAAYGSNRLLGTQVGWPILGGALLALAGLLVPRVRRQLARRGVALPGMAIVASLLLMFALAFLVTWSPTSKFTDAFWKRVPEIFTYLQFTYRVLIFTTLFGAMLLACALAAWGRALHAPHPKPLAGSRRFRSLLPGIPERGNQASVHLARRRGWGGIVAGLFVVGLFAASYATPRLDKLPHAALEAVKDAPDVGTAGGSTMYTMFSEALKRTDVLQSAQAEGYAYVTRDQVRAAVRRKRVTRYRPTFDRPTLVELPVLFYPGLQRVYDNGKRIDYANVGHWMALKLQPGRHSVEIKFVGVRWANWVSLGVWLAVLCWLFIAGRRKRRAGARPCRSREWAGGVLFAGAVGAGVAMPFDRVRRFVEPPRVLAATSSRIGPDPTGDARNAVDGNITTSWIPGGVDPVALTLVPDRPGRLVRIIFQARRPGMMAGWHTVRIEAFYKGGPIGVHELTFPWAWRELEQRADLRNVPCDKVVLHFRDPVTLMPDGAPVPANAIDPGYMEIRLEWEQ